MALLTAGQRRHDRHTLGALLGGAGVDVVVDVDVRRFPGSRAHPDLRREALEEWLPAGAVPAGREVHWPAEELRSGR